MLIVKQNCLPAGCPKNTVSSRKKAEIICPGELLETSEKYDQSLAEVPKTKKRSKTVERIRDLKKMLMNQACLRILALEEQNYIDYGSGVHCPQYDLLGYGKQMAAIRDRNEQEQTEMTISEKLCGLRKTDRLIPVYTIWFYYGTEPYDGPRSLSDMMTEIFIKDYVCIFLHSFTLILNKIL